MTINKIILGDNRDILRQIDDNSVDLIYLDPPFFSNRNYEIIWGDEGEIRSFQDRWAGGIEHYIAWLKERVYEMYRVLKKTGTLFLHCDWHADAYIRVEILDKIFGKNNFRNEIIWYYRRWTAGKTFQRMHDNILFYSKTQSFTFNKTYVEPTKGQKIKHEKGWDRNSVVINGKRQAQLLIYDQEKVDIAISEGRIRLSDYAKIHSLGDTQTTSPDVWEINYLNSQSKERIGYPTQKPEALLERIIRCASNEGDLVLDPFVGGGTTIAVADKLKRSWIGIDQSVQAVKVSELRLQKQQDLFSKPFIVQLHKYDYDTLRYADSFEFEDWIVRQYGGTANTKQRNDYGIDGRMSDNTPIQVKRSDSIGRNVLDNFMSAVRRFDKVLLEKNKKEKKPVGHLIAFSFNKGIKEETARLRNQEGIIKLVTVEDIVPIANKPAIRIEISEKSRNKKDIWDLELTATGRSDAGIEFYSWDCSYDPKNGFKPSQIIDKEGRHRHQFKVGQHLVAVKVVDNDGLENIEVIKLQINGKIKKNTLNSKQ
jgi:DNA modification methylase